MKKIIIGLLGLVGLAIAAFFIVLHFFPQTFLNYYRAYEHSKADYGDIQTIAVDGYTWHYVDTIEKSGKDADVILMVHGFGGDKDNWTLLSQQLRKTLPDHRLIAVDLPGFGDNTRDTQLSYQIPEQSARVNAFIKAMELPAVTLVGNSMGGHIAGYTAATYPESVKHLILLNSAGVMMPEKSELVLTMEKGGANPLLVTDADDFDRLMNFVFVTPPSIPEPLKAYFAEKAVESRAFNENVFVQIRNFANYLEPKLVNIQQPTLVVWGDTDRVLDKSSVQVFEQGIKNTKTVIFENAGHIPQAERPQELAEEIKAFLQ